MAEKKGVSGERIPPARPPRYNDALGLSDRDEDDDATAAAGTSRPASGAPASTLRSRSGDSGRGTFEREAREDDPGDPDRKSKKPRQQYDSISERLGLTEYSPGAAFDWCRNSYGHMHAFSRRYNQPAVLVDLFAGDGPDVRAEVASKRAQVIAHNERAAAIVAEMRARAEAAAVKLFERLGPAGEPNNSLEAITARELEAGMTYLRNVGEIPFGYLPVIGFPRELDVEALRNGKVFDLPPAANYDDFLGTGTMLGVAVSR